jgi:hypothetical protein
VSRNAEGESGEKWNAWQKTSSGCFVAHRHELVKWCRGAEQSSGEKSVFAFASLRLRRTRFGILLAWLRHA